MARTTRVVLTCDLHKTETEATSTAVITLNGSRYELDVCDQHAAELVAKARRPRPGAAARKTPATKKPDAKRGSRRTTTKKAPTRKRTPRRVAGVADIRAWASDNGYAISPRGRIATTVLDAYHAAHT